jgi:Tol biopolymer transport system component
MTGIETMNVPNEASKPIPNAPALAGPGRQARRLRLTATPLLMMALVLVLAACGEPKLSPLAEAQAKLTAEAGGVAALGGATEVAAVATSPAGESGGGSLQVPTTAPASAESGLEGLPLPSDPSDDFNSPVSDDPEGEAAKQRADADATAGIPNVDSLVMSMPALATFTPEAKAATVQGSLLYVRNGSFWRSNGASGDATKVNLGADTPAIWAPPEDPGRAWISPDGKRLAFLAGSDAEMWVTGTDGKGAKRISGPNLPPEIHTISAGTESQDVRIQPGRHYTLVKVEAGSDAFGVLVDDVSDQRRGFIRLRFVHAIAGMADSQLQVYVNGAPFGGPLRLGKGSGEIAVPVGAIQVELRDLKGKVVADLEDIQAVDKQILSVFLVGTASEVRSVPVVYEYEPSPGSAAKVRIFNGTGKSLDVRADSDLPLVGKLAPAAIGPFVRIPATMSTDERENLQLGIYGNRTREQPVAWAPKSDRLAWIGGGDGNSDLYISDLSGTAQRLTENARIELNPVWSADGHLAWLAQELSVIRYEMQYQRKDGELQTVDFGPLRAKLGLDATKKVFFPDEILWVDGDRFALLPAVDNLSIGVWIVDTRDGSVTQAYDGVITTARWSPVTKAWVFSPDDETGKLMLLPLDGKARVLSENDAFNGMWSPDGKLISYVEGQKMSPEGWVIHVIDADGKNDRAITPRWPLVQFDPPVPGPNAKRYWLDDNKRIIFSRVGRDSGAAERAGFGRVQEAGPDLENWYEARVDDAKATPRMLSDLTQAFYLDNLSQAPKSGDLAFNGLSYQSRTQQLWAMPSSGGKPIQIDGPVRWFAWMP